MGFSMKNLEYLSSKGYLSNPHCAILDIGSQNLYHASPEAIRVFVERHGLISDSRAFEEEAKRISYFSWPRPGERTSYLSELLDLTAFEYTSYDVCPALKTEIFDLNEEHLPSHYREHFDIILNFGTTEHIINQLNSFRVMHDALKVGGIFFHQLPSVGWIDHGYFCYHECFFTDLANSNGYEIVELWYTLAGQSSLSAEDIRDPEKPEVPCSGNCSSELLKVPSFNLNVILRKKVSRTFAVGLELATSHSALSADIASLYAGGGRAFSANGMAAPVQSSSSASGIARHVSAISGKELLTELGRRVARRLGLSSSQVGVPVEVTTKLSAPESVAIPNQQPEPDVFPALLITGLTGNVDEPHEYSLDAMLCVEKARILLGQSRVAEAFGYLNRARAIVHQFPHAMIELRKISRMYSQAASQAWANGEGKQAAEMATLALEADPHAQAPRDLLAIIESKNPGSDITRHCFIFYDSERASQIHREAIRRCLEFTAISGVIGDVLEFGVLAGWSSRIFAETMRDCMIMGNLHLYDSFAGLPEYDSVIDRDSYEIAGRNIWSDKMKFPDEFIATLGGDLEQHIKAKLSMILRPERIQTHQGFYSESLKQPIESKAALVHIDCDLYQSTVEVLDALYRDNVLQDGCVMMFDDWNCNKANPDFGERRAFREFLEKQTRYTASQFFTYGFNGAAFILHEVAKQ